MTEYATLRERISAEKAERAERYAEFQRIYDNAVVAGRHAGDACIPQPMYVRGYPEPIEGGVCGFAWVNVRPGTSSFARWLVKQGYAHKDSYAGGVTIWVRGYGQSMERKSAYADAVADMLRAHFPDMRIYATSRMD